jgi:hypothetical protein
MKKCESEFLSGQKGSSSDDWSPSKSPLAKKRAEGTTFATATFNQKKEALEYYRNTTQGYRSLSSMNSHFRFIKSEADLNALRRLKHLIKK